MVETKYFEQITIQEVAKEAGVSVGTFYRRFPSKEAALPALYQDFQIELREWIEVNEPRWKTITLEELIYSLTADIYEFLAVSAV